MLDPAPAAIGPLAAADLLTLFAGQAAIALAVIRRNRSARRMLAQNGADLAGLAAVATLLGELGADRRAAGVNLLDSVSQLLAPPG